MDDGTWHCVAPLAHVPKNVFLHLAIDRDGKFWATILPSYGEDDYV